MFLNLGVQLANQLLASSSHGNILQSIDEFRLDVWRPGAIIEIEADSFSVEREVFFSGVPSERRFRDRV